MSVYLYLWDRTLTRTSPAFLNLPLSPPLPPCVQLLLKGGVDVCGLTGLLLAQDGIGSVIQVYTIWLVVNTT